MYAQALFAAALLTFNQDSPQKPAPEQAFGQVVYHFVVNDEEDETKLVAQATMDAWGVVIEARNPEDAEKVALQLSKVAPVYQGASSLAELLQTAKAAHIDVAPLTKILEDVLPDVPRVIPAPEEVSAVRMELQIYAHHLTDEQLEKIQQTLEEAFTHFAQEMRNEQRPEGERAALYILLSRLVDRLTQ